MGIMELGAIGELLGGIAVIGSLIYVGLQLRQNTLATHAQAVSARLGGQMATDRALMGDDTAQAVARAFDAPGELTTAEVLKIYAYLGTILTGLQSTFEAYTLGHASRNAWDAAREAATVYLGFPFGRVLWNATKDIFPAEFVRDVEDALERFEPDRLRTQIAQMKQAAQELAAGA